MNNNRNIWIDYLRTTITIMVVAHHSSLAYTTFATFNKEAYINSTHPIVDSARWVGLDIFENYNDQFFISLMFLIGGLFLIKSINRKGTLEFVKDRFIRLFIPFLFIGTPLMLLAYFPSFYLAHNNTDIIAYIKDFFTVESWPVGPPWFIWVLFLFNLIFALVYKQLINLLNHFEVKIKIVKTFHFLLILFTLTWLLYVPAAYYFGIGTWFGIGPFDFQLSRIAQYFGYFIIGIVIGHYDFNNNIFSNHSKLVSKWWMWSSLSLLLYSFLTIAPPHLTKMVIDSSISELTGWMIYLTLYSATCTISTIAFLTIFRRWMKTENCIWNSLSNNAFLIYLTHYIFITWVQFSLLSINLSAFTKFVITFSTTLVLSWILSHLLKKIKIINRYV